ncbi:hypothetical protein BKA70DRAFT_1184870 [Coprinopsis sp. MPI-PUGE-AT-0042]|nr:hypothetical protein BKA70DRAFT_1184870 [Coprinopsis sp. MPI-PUGE-AT-0042]
MHPCLKIPEILSNIFSDAWCAQPTLARLARTCKIFHEPAIRQLWRKLPGFHPILKLLPENVVSRDTNLNECFDTVETFEWNECQGLKPCFARMKYYGSHVRRLDWVRCNHYLRRFSVHHSVFRKLSEHRDFRRPLFPNLKEVVLPYAQYDPLVAVFYPSLVLSPSVQTIHVEADEYKLVDAEEIYADITNHYWMALFGRLRMVAPALRQFKILSAGFHDSFFLLGKLGAFQQIADRFSSAMTCLKLSSLILDGETLVSLRQSNLAALTNLSISAFKRSARLPSPSHTTLALPSLERLSIRIASFGTCVAILNLLDAPKLKKLKLKAYMGWDEDDGTVFNNYDPQPLFHALQAKGMHEHLEMLHLKKNWIEPDDEWTWWVYCNEHRFIVTPETVGPLQPFFKMTSLIISPCDTSQFDDGALASMFGSWPRLEECILSDETFHSTPPLLTIAGVHFALQQVPLLKSLTLRFDGKVIPDDGRLESCSLPHPSLQTLDVCSSTISTTSSGDPFAAWLQRCYPKLATVSSLTRYRSAMDSVYDLGSMADEDRDRFMRYISLATMVDRWNDVMEVYKEFLNSRLYC